MSVCLYVRCEEMHDGNCMREHKTLSNNIKCDGGEVFTLSDIEIQRKDCKPHASVKVKFWFEFL